MYDILFVTTQAWLSRIPCLRVSLNIVSKCQKIPRYVKHRYATGTSTFDIAIIMVPLALFVKKYGVSITTEFKNRFRFRVRYSVGSRPPGF